MAVNLLLSSKMRMSDWAHLRSEFIWIYEGAVEDKYLEAQEHYPGQSALLLREGTLRVETEHGAVKANPGQWCFPTARPRLQTFTKGSRVLSLRFKVTWPGGQPLFDSDIALVVEAARTPDLETKARSLLALLTQVMPGARNDLPFRHGTLQDHFVLHNAFSTWLCSFVENMLELGLSPNRLGPLDERVLHALHILDELPLDRSLDMRWLAGQIGLSSSQLDRIFTRQFSLTPRQYFEKRRLEQAMELLQSSPLTVKQIAYELGFLSLPYFSRWFRQKSGSAPREFQNQTTA